MLSDEQVSVQSILGILLTFRILSTSNLSGVQHLLMRIRQTAASVVWISARLASPYCSFVPGLYTKARASFTSCLSNLNIPTTCVSSEHVYLCSLCIFVQVELKALNMKRKWVKVILCLLAQL